MGSVLINPFCPRMGVIARWSAPGKLGFFGEEACMSEVNHVAPRQPSLQAGHAIQPTRARSMVSLRFTSLDSKDWTNP